MEKKPRGYWGIIWRKKPPEARALSAAKSRCNNPRCENYAQYGGRGIRVCEEWSGRDGVERFLEHIGPRPSPEHSLDRINNDGNYEPGNVRWATQQQQTENTRRNVWIEWRGETRTAADWARATGIPRNVIGHRLARGWDLERALTTPTIGRETTVCGNPVGSSAPDGQAEEPVVLENPAKQRGKLL